MKKTMLAVFMLVLMASPCFAQGVIFEQYVPVTTGTTYFVSVPDDVQGGIIQVIGISPARLSFGKLSASSTKGIYLAPYATYEFKTRGEMVNAVFITDSTGSGTSLYGIGYDYRNR